MRGWIGLLGPLALAAGLWLLLPDPHPWMATGTALLIGLAGAAIALLGVVFRSQATVAIGAAGAIILALPAQLPIGPTGPVLQVLGLALALEGARSRQERVPVPPIRAWGLPALLVLVGSLVVVGALATDVGRESLDITQGLGLAASAPFLLLAAWGILRAIGARVGGPATAVLVAVLVLPGLLAAVPTADAQGPGQFPDWSHAVDRQFLVTENGAQNVTGGFWDINASQAMLLGFHFDADHIANWTFESASLVMSFPGRPSEATECSERAFTLERAMGPWDGSTTLATLPDGTNPRTQSRTLEGCTGSETLEFNITTDAQAWADGEAKHGWIFRMTSGSGESGGSNTPGTQGFFTEYPPEITAIETEPAVRDEDRLMAPVGGTIWLNATIDDERGGVRQAGLDLDDTRLFNRTLEHDDRANLTLDVTEANANGTLVLQTDDWDGNIDRAFVAELRPDRVRPTLKPSEGHSLDLQGNRWVVPDPIPVGRTRTVDANITDDACTFVDDCVALLAFNSTGALVANATGPGDVTFQIPTDRPGDHRLRLVARDAADRERLALLDYRVSEPNAPTIEDLAVRGALGRPSVQEAGLPVSVRFTTTDVSPPLSAELVARSNTLDQDVLETGNGTLRLSGVIETAGPATLRLQVTDRWGNTATETRSIEILPARAPVIELPTSGFLGERARLDAFVRDVTVEPDGIDVRILSAGTPLAPENVERVVTDEGVDLAVTMPELLHGEQIQLVVDATDALGQQATAQQSFTIDLEAPRLTVEPSVGARIGTTLWTTPNATLAVSAEDRDSGLVDLRILSPFEEALDPAGTTLNISRIGTRTALIQATDEIGNQANWTGAVRLDERAPRLDLAIDGHTLVVTAEEAESGLQSLTVTSEGTQLSMPSVNGTHEVTLPGVTRGDVVNVSASATDAVGQTAELARELTVGDGPPRISVESQDGRDVRVQTSDPDGDELTVTATITHDVNRTQQAIPVSSNGTVRLPDWRGDVTVRLVASAHGASERAFANATLGEGPFLHAALPDGFTPGQETEIPVTWDRDYQRVTVTVTRDGAQVSVAEVTPTGDGTGVATITLPEEGSYQLELTGEHRDGTVQTASVGQVEASEGVPNIVLILIALVLVALAGLAALFVIREREENEAGPP